LKRNTKLISGRDIRYYNYHSGTVAKGRSRILTVILPICIVFAALGGGGYFGYQQFNLMTSPQTVLQSNETPAQDPANIDEQDADNLSQQAFRLREDEKLSSEIANKIDDMPKSITWAVSVRDLNTGRMANINADRKMESASLYKLFLLPALEKKINADNWKSRLGKGTINDCVIAMIKVSDNECPKAVGDYAGWKNVNPLNASLGFTHTNISDKVGNTTTARDVSEMMYRLQNSQILSDKGRRTVFDALYAQKFRSGIPKGCGQDCLVANKTGDIDNVKHDAAIVTHDNARYVVVIMTENGSWQNIADLAEQIDNIMLP